MTEEMKWPPESRTYYYVASNNASDCELAIKRAIEIANSLDKKITVLIDKYDYDIGFEDNEIFEKIVKIANLNKDDIITCWHRGCRFNLFVSDVEQNEIYNTVLIYGASCGDAMRSAYESCAQNIILIPTCTTEWDLFTIAMQPVLIE